MAFLLKLCFWGSAAAIAAFSLLPLGHLLPDILLNLLPFDLRAEAPGSDKFWHFIAYAVLGFFGFCAYRGRLPAMPLIALLFLYGVLMELLQSLIPNRVMSGLDMVANGGGIATGVAAAALLLFALTLTARRRPGTASPE